MYRILVVDDEPQIVELLQIKIHLSRVKIHIYNFCYNIHIHTKGDKIY